MLIIQNFLLTILELIAWITEIYTYIILASVIVSWIRLDPYHPIVRFLSSLTEPVFGFVRRRLPPALFRHGLDWSPFIVLVSIFILQNVIAKTLQQIHFR